MEERTANTDRERIIRELVADICEVEPAEVTPDADFVEDLGMDSMQALEIMAAIEKTFSVEIPEEYLGQVNNLSRLLEIAEELINGA